MASRARAPQNTEATTAGWRKLPGRLGGTMETVANSGSQGFTWGRRHTLTVLMMLAAAIGYSDRVNMSVAAVAMQQHFAWSQTMKGAVMSAFFVGYLGFMLAGGFLAARYGGRRVLGYAVLWWSAWTLLTPVAAHTSLQALIGARIAIGAGEALLFPAVYEMASRWAPRDEYTRLTSVTASGIPLGTVVGLLGTGWLLTRFDWPSAFYVFGVVGLGWCVLWFAMARDRPDLDPRVTPTERELLAREAEPARSETMARGARCFGIVPRGRCSPRISPTPGRSTSCSAGCPAICARCST